MSLVPQEALFPGEHPFPILPSCDHFAGTERLITRALDLQAQMGWTFDVTMDLEDGAPAGREREHAEMVVRLLRSDKNQRRMAGVRIHGPGHPAWTSDVDLVVASAADVLRHLTVPKATSTREVAAVIQAIQAASARAGLTRHLPIHVLIETHGALRDVHAISALPWVEVLDFGLMDFVSGHHGAVPAAAMRSPGQFEHPLILRAKLEVVAAALGRGLVPAHNVTLDLRDPYQTHADAKAARDLGFLRMWSIHPVQIQPIVDAMAPDYGDVEQACEVLLLAQKADWGPIRHGSSLHDRATYRYFWNLIQRARLSGQKLPDAVAVFFAKGASNPA